MKIIAFTALAFGLCACAYPVSRIEQGAGPSSLYVPKAPAGVILSVDGVDAGPAENYDDKHAYAVSPGKHRVVLKGASGLILDKSVYVGAGSHVAVEIAQ